MADEARYTEFRHEIESVINKFSMERNSNTPDYILANYLARCLSNFDASVADRDRWYGVNLAPGSAVMAEAATLVERDEEPVIRGYAKPNDLKGYGYPKHSDPGSGAFPGDG